MGDDDKKQTDASRMSAPPPDYDDDDVTRLTPGDELARWRRIAAREEAAAPPREPAPPASRPARPGAPPPPAADEKTPARGIGPVESTPTRAISVPGFGDEGPGDEHAVSKASLRDAPVSFPGQPPRASASAETGRASAPPRLSPVPARTPGAAQPPGAARPVGVFGAPRADPPIALTERRSVPPAPAAGMGQPSLPPAPPGPFEARAKPALAPPPPSLSLPPRVEPSIPPAPPLGFDAPTVRPIPTAQPSGTGRIAAVFLLVLIAAGLVVVGRYLWSTGVLNTLLSGGRPAPTLAAPPGPPAGAPSPPALTGVTAPAAVPGAELAPPAIGTPPTPTVTPGAPPAGAAPGVAVTGTPAEPAPGAAVTGTPAEPAPGAAPTGTPGSAADLARGDAALRDGDAAAALEAYRAVIAADPFDPYGFAGAARASLALGQPEEAISFALRAVAHRQRRASFRVLLGDAYEAHGEHARALEEWRSARELEPDNREAASRPTE